MSGLKERAKSLVDQYVLRDEPDCLAELEFEFSVFRFRYAWGTVYEVTVTNLADGPARAAAFDLLPHGAVYLDALDTNTTGVGKNGVYTEVTHRFVTEQI